MSINQASSSSLSDLFQLLQAAEGKQTAAASSSTVASATTSSGASSDLASVSDPAKLLKELEQLSKTNPAEFKKITAVIAQQLTAAAKDSADPTQALALTTLASDFTKASKSGNLSALFSQSNGSSGSDISAASSTTSAYSSNSSNSVESIFSEALHTIQSDLPGTTRTGSNG